MFWIRKRPFLARKAPKRALNFFLKKRHNFCQRRHNLGIFFWKWLTICWQYQFLLHFYVIIFSKYPKYNISQRFFNIFNWKISFWRFFLIILGAPNYFWRHKEFQKRHSGAKAPLLATLNLRIFSGYGVIKKKNKSWRNIFQLLSQPHTQFFFHYENKVPSTFIIITKHLQHI